jgi:RND superfamily putative drug exporter
MEEDNYKPNWLTRIPSGRISKWLVVVAWVAVVAVAVPLSSKLSDAQSNDISSWLPQKAESTEALKIQNKFQSPHDIPAVIVYERKSGLTSADKSKLMRDAHDYVRVEHVTGKVIGPIISKDGKAAQIIVVGDLGADYWNNAGTFNDKIVKVAANGANGLTFHITGPVGMAADQSKAFNGIDSTLLYSALVVVTVLLLITYRSPVLWLLPVIAAGVALTSAQAIIYALARHAGLTVNGQSAGILTVLVFGAATDYALLLIARYREELHSHKDRHLAMGLALRRAGPAIIASASTVALGMLCLLAAELNSTKGLGPVAAIGIAVGLLAVITLLPALLVIAGRWIFWPLLPKYGEEPRVNRGVWARIGRGIARRPRLIWILTTLALLVMSLGLTQGHVKTLVGKDAYPTKPPSVLGEEILEAHFPAAGTGTPVVIVGKAGAASKLHSAVEHVSGLTNITAPKTNDGYVLIEGTLTTDPNSQASYDAVKRTRDAVKQVPGADAKVGGTTAITLDQENASKRDSIVVIPIVLAVVFVILALLLRALAAPLMLIITVVLSFLAALGVSAVVFNHVFHFAGIDWGFPLFVFIFLVALGIDYNIFLMSRVREESVRHDTHRGALIALAATGAVITSAGLVLAGTFAVLGSLPMVFFSELGFAVAFGVLLDTLVVRSVLVTSLTLDLGRRVWWPSRLSRPGRAAESPAAPAASQPEPPLQTEPEPHPQAEPAPQPAPVIPPKPEPRPHRPVHGISGDIRPRSK